MPAFIKTRLILSLWYTFILFVILLAFSISLSITYNNDVTRIVLRQDFGNRVPKVLSRTEMRLVVAQVRELRSTSRLDLFVIDFITLLLSSGLSYFLAGKTLAPVQKSMENQKQFIADASHELRSPITIIQTTCEVALRSSQRKTKEDYLKAVEQVFDQSQRMGRLVSDLLSLSVLDAGTSSQELKDCSLSTLVSKELDAMQPVFKKDGIVLEQAISAHVRVLGDEDRIRQLLLILLDNARKYTSSGGKVSVIVRSKPQLGFEVKDTGIGIPREKQASIFRRFYQVDRSHTGSGAGLGLAIAFSIMQLHKGQISVESVEGKGTTFVCNFPKL